MILPALPKMVSDFTTQQYCIRPVKTWLLFSADSIKLVTHLQGRVTMECQKRCTLMIPMEMEWNFIGTDRMSNGLNRKMVRWTCLPNHLICKAYYANLIISNYFVK